MPRECRITGAASGKQLLKLIWASELYILLIDSDMDDMDSYQHEVNSKSNKLGPSLTPNSLSSLDSLLSSALVTMIDHEFVNFYWWQNSIAGIHPPRLCIIELAT